MTIIPYNEFKNMIPNDTKSFLMRLFGYLYGDEEISIEGETLHSNEELFYKAVVAYTDISEVNASAATLAGLKIKKSINNRGTSESQDKGFYSEYYKALMPFKNKEAYYALTPEEILKNIFKKILNNSSSWMLDQAFDNDVETFIKKLSNGIQPKKNILLTELTQSFNKDFSIDVINYFDMAARIYAYLKNNYEEITNIGQTNEEWAELAMFLAMFYYKGVTSADGKVNEQEVITDYLEEKDIDASSIESELEINIDSNELETMGSQILIEIGEFKRFFLTDYYKKNTTVNLLFESIIRSNDKRTSTIPRLFANLGGSEADIKAISERIKEAREKINDSALSDLYKNIMPDVIEFIRKLAHIYTYLQSKKANINSDYLRSDKDYIATAILLASYDYDTKLKTFLLGNGIDLKFVLSSLGLPSTKEEYEEDLNKVDSDEKNAVKFEYLINNGYNYRSSKERYTVEAIIRNLDDASRTDSQLVHRLYRTKTGTDLNSSFDSQMNEFINAKEKDRKSELTERLLENVSIDVYNYLKLICSYFICLSNCKLSSVDHEQISIIFAATRYNDRFLNYLNSVGITRDGFIKQFNLSYSFYDKDFDIDIINNHFAKYIFDRPAEEITVYSIFENAFEPALKNSINLRNALFAMGHKPEDFLDIEAKMDAYEKEEEERKRKAEQDSLFNKCTEQARDIVTDALYLYRYIDANKDSIDIVSTEKDVKELSMLIAILHRCRQEYGKYFEVNGITLEELTELINLNAESFETLYSKPIDRSLILNFAEYLSDSYISIGYLIKALFNDFVNNSQVIEKIVEKNGNVYSELKEEVQEKKDKPLTPAQRMEVLSNEQIEVLDPSSIIGVADYGSNISQHSKYITEALRQLTFDDSLDHASEEINDILSEISYEEKVPSTEKVSFFDRLIGYEPEPTVIKKYNPTKIEEVGPKMESQVMALRKELKGYDYLKKYIEAYLIKLTQYLEQLKTVYAKLETQELDDNLDETTKFIKGLDQNSAKERLYNKIQSFETMILLMKQELVTVHRAIINHFIAINSLDVSKMAILPLISSEMAISAGQETEGETLKLTGELVSLLQNVVNKNIEGTKENLSRLSMSSISEETFEALNTQVSSYLETVNRGEKLIGSFEQPIDVDSVEVQPEDGGPEDDDGTPKLKF